MHSTQFLQGFVGTAVAFVVTNVHLARVLTSPPCSLEQIIKRSLRNLVVETLGRPPTDDMVLAALSQGLLRAGARAPRPWRAHIRWAPDFRVQHFVCTAAMEPVINVAIVAHVDHGKTTLVDVMLKHCQEDGGDRAMDRMSQEKERGITIMSKVTSMTAEGVRFNVVDTPGHADFGGEVRDSSCPMIASC